MSAEYSAPELKLTEIVVEKGFAGSPGNIVDGFDLYAPGYGEGETL